MEVRIKAEEKDGKTKVTTNINGDLSLISIPAIAAGMAQAVINMLEDSCKSNTFHGALLLTSKDMFNKKIDEEVKRVAKEAEVHEEKKKDPIDSDEKDKAADELVALIKDFNRIMGSIFGD